MIKLTDKTRKLIKALYDSEKEQQRVAAQLETRCAENIPFCEKSTPQQMERIRFAVLKLTREKGRFEYWMQEAAVDWRDLFMAAGFGEDTVAHDRWADEIIKGLKS